MRARYRVTLTLAAFMGLASASAAQEPVVPQADKTAPRMETAPPHPPPDFRQLPRQDDQPAQGGPPAPQAGGTPLGPPPAELAQALHSMVHELTDQRADALTRALMAENQLKACQVKTP